MARYTLNGNPRISSVHGEKTNMGHFGRHLGIDRVVVNQPFFAPSAGRIITTGKSASLGNFIEAEILGYHWRFAHLSRIDVKSGNFKEGAQLGVTGNTGITTGPHLHYDARKLGTAWNASFANYVDPDAVIAAAISAAKGFQVGDTVKLSSKVDKWRVYRLGVEPKKGNEFTFLKPAKFGGLVYRLLEATKWKNTFVIQTSDYGKVQIFLDADASKV